MSSLFTRKFSFWILLFTSIFLTHIAQAALIVTDNVSGTEIDGFIENSGAAELDSYFLSEDFNDTSLDIMNSSSLIDGAIVTGGFSDATATLELSVADLGSEYTIYSNIDVTAIVDLGDKDTSSNVASDGGASALSFIDLSFALDTSYNFTAVSDMFDAQSTADAEFYAELSSVDDDTIFFSTFVTDDISMLSFAGLLGPGEYLLSLGVTADVASITGSESAGGDLLLSLTEVATVPVPAAIWLFGSGLVGLVGFAGRVRRH